MTIQYAIDVSGYDGRRWVWDIRGGRLVYDLPMDWARARDEGDVRLAIMKSSEGLFEDRAFRMNWRGARGVLPRTAYHFFRSNVNAIQQAGFFANLLDSDFDRETDYAIVDFETMDGQTGAQCLRNLASFLYEMEKHLIIPLIYTYPSFWRAIGGEGATWAKRYPLALAQWPWDNWFKNIKLPPFVWTAAQLATKKILIEGGWVRPMKLLPWEGDPAIWQFTARAEPASVPGHPGVKKAVDYNAVYMPLPNVQGSPAPVFVPPGLPPVDSAGLGAHQVTALSLRLFSGPGDIFKQLAASPLKFGQVVNVLEIKTARGEQWGRIETPAGWCRLVWLAKI